MSNLPQTGWGKTEWRYTTFAMRISGEFLALIAAPALGAGWLGTRLDVRYGSRPLWLIVCLLVSFTFTALIVWYRAKAIGREYDAIGQTSESPQSQQK